MFPYEDSKTVSVCQYPEKRNHPGLVNISPTIVIDTSMGRSSRVFHHEKSKIASRSPLQQLGRGIGSASSATWRQTSGGGRSLTLTVWSLSSLRSIMKSRLLPKVVVSIMKSRLLPAGLPFSNWAEELVAHPLLRGGKRLVGVDLSRSRCGHCLPFAPISTVLGSGHTKRYIARC